MKKRNMKKAMAFIPVSIRFTASDYAQLRKVAPDGETVGRMLKSIALKLIHGKQYANMYIKTYCKEL